MTEGKDSRETVSMSTNDDGEAKRVQHQRALLHNAPKAPLREPKPGELLMTFEHGQDVYRVELRDFQPNGVMRRGLNNELDHEVESRQLAQGCSNGKGMDRCRRNGRIVRLHRSGAGVDDFYDGRRPG
jgi:hypothetical protein